jgi:hypothetical protein
MNGLQLAPANAALCGGNLIGSAVHFVMSAVARPHFGGIWAAFQPHEQASGVSASVLDALAIVVCFCATIHWLVNISEMNSRSGIWHGGSLRKALFCNVGYGACSMSSMAPKYRTIQILVQTITQLLGYMYPEISISYIHGDIRQNGQISSGPT